MNTVIEFGRLLNIRKEVMGTVLMVQTLTTDTILQVDNVLDFSEDGGRLSVPSGAVHNYSGINMDATPYPTLLLEAAIGAVIAVDESIDVYPAAPEYIAEVALDDQAAEKVDATVPHFLVPYFDIGVADPTTAPGIRLELDELGNRRVTDILQSEPDMDMEFGREGTFPPTPSDGIPPTTSPTPTVLGGIGILLVKWTPITNADAVSYEIHMSSASGFTPGPTTLAGEISGSIFTIKEQTGADGGGPLVYGTTYYVKTIAKDVDGPATASAEGSGTMVQVNSGDIAASSIIAQHLLAGSIDASKLAAEIILASTLYVPNTVGQRVVISADGVQLVASSGEVLVDIPTDSSKDPTFAGEIIAGALDVIGDAHFRGMGNVLDKGGRLTLALGIGEPVTKPTVSSVWDHQDVGTNDIYDDLRYGLVYTTAGGASETVASFVTLHQPSTANILRLIEVTAAAPATIARSAQIHSSGSSFTPMGVTHHAGSYYALIQYTGTSVFHVLRVRVSDLVVTNVYDITSQVNSVLDEMHIGSDGTNIIIVDRAGGGSPTFYRFRKFDASMAFVSSLNTDFNPGSTGPYTGCSMVVRDDGSGVRYWLGAQNALIVHSFTAAGAHQPNECFEAEYSYLKGLAHDGTQFWSNGAWGGMSKHTNWRWTTESAVYWVGYTWYDDAGTAHESTIGPRQSLTHKKRSKMRVTTGVIPVGGAEDPNKVRVYINRGASEPQASGRFSGFLQATDALTVRDLVDFDAAGTPPENPATNNFPGGTPAELRSSGGEPLLRANGFSRMKVTCGTQGIANDIAEGIEYGTEQVDTDNYHTPTAADFIGSTINTDMQHTLPFAGQYLVIPGVVFANNNVGRRVINVFKNTTVYESASQPPVTGAATQMNPTFVVDAAAGDYIVIKVLQNSGGVLNCTARLSIVYLGPA